MVMKGKFPFIIDSGASNHVCSNIALFQNVERLDKPRMMTLGDNSTLTCTRTGCVMVCLEKIPYLRENNTYILLTNVLYVEDSMFIVSVSALAMNGINTSFYSGACYFTTVEDKDETIGQGKMMPDGLYTIMGYPLVPNE
jgi:hypothetical protein